MFVDRRKVSRREFLRLGGAGLAGAALLGGAAGCGGAGSGGGEGGGGQSYNFRLAETQPEDHPTTRADKEFARLLKKSSDGRINVKVFPNSQLGEEADVIEQVKLGSIEMTRVSTSPLTEFAKAMGVFSLPYIFESSDHMWSFLTSEDGQALLGKLEPSGYKGLAYYDSGARDIYTAKKEVRTLGDVKGLKIRVQKSDVNVSFMKALGVSATPMDYGEVYSALQTGVIDGAENNFPSYLSSGHYEVAKNLTETEHQRIPEALIMSKQTWDQMSEDDQKLVQDAATKSVDAQRKYWSDAEKEARQQLDKKGVNIIKLDDLDAWKQAVQPVIESYHDEYGEYLDQIEAAK